MLQGQALKCQLFSLATSIAFTHVCKSQAHSDGLYKQAALCLPYLTLTGVPE